MVNAPLLPLAATGIEVVRRGRRILGPVDLEFGASGLTLVIGPNGSGKTTLLKTLHGVERLSGGKIRWAVPMGQARHRQAYVFQAPIMLRRSVRENLAYPLRLDRRPKTEIARACEEWATRIGLGDALDRQATRLSGGEKQKLAIARALIRAPEMLFLDEPCANLDGRAMREIEEILETAHAAGTRILMATHNMGQIRRLATDVIFLLNGRIHEAGSADDIIDRPKTAELSAFLKGDIVE